MTHTIDATIGDRDLTVEFEWEEREPPSFTDPGTPGGPQIVAVWEDDAPVEISDDEGDAIVSAIRAISDEREDYDYADD